MEFGVWLSVILVFAIGSVWIVFGDNSDNWSFWCFLLGCWLVGYGFSTLVLVVCCFSVFVGL